MSQHTPGPWTIVDDEIHAGDVHVVCFGHDYEEYGSIGARPADGGTWLKAERAKYEAEVAANRILIAAAPDLLAALKDAAEWMYNPFEPDNQSPRYARIMAIIAKAEGK